MNPNWLIPSMQVTVMGYQQDSKRFSFSNVLLLSLHAYVVREVRALHVFGFEYLL
jgi:hypothetical protein